jgi:hypothetical protein
MDRPAPPRSGGAALPVVGTERSGGGLLVPRGRRGGGTSVGAGELRGVAHGSLPPSRPPLLLRGGALLLLGALAALGIVAVLLHGGALPDARSGGVASQPPRAVRKHLGRVRAGGGGAVESDADARRAAAHAAAAAMAAAAAENPLVAAQRDALMALQSSALRLQEENAALTQQLARRDSNSGNGSSITSTSATPGPPLSEDDATVRASPLLRLSSHFLRCHVLTPARAFSPACAGCVSERARCGARRRAGPARAHRHYAVVLS